MTKFDAVIFIGRFQPLHVAHVATMMQAFDHSYHLIILIGSANRPPSVQNPFNFAQRKTLIEQSISVPAHCRLSCLPVDDVFYNDHLWLQKVQQAVKCATNGANLAIIGHQKDDSSYYLHLFPRWTWLALPNFDNLSATAIRSRYFATGEIDDSVLPKASTQLLQAFFTSANYARLKNEAQYLEKNLQDYAHLPYAPIFHTADALVVQAGYVLVVRRGGDYGAGLLALPGGFVEAGETLQACALRELGEETGLHLSGQFLRKSQCFDAPKRSLRGRIITTVFLFALTGEGLPLLAAGDDAADAFWLPLGELRGDDFFEDHYGIICAMLGVS